MDSASWGHARGFRGDFHDLIRERTHVVPTGGSCDLRVFGFAKSTGSGTSLLVGENCFRNGILPAVTIGTFSVDLSREVERLIAPPREVEIARGDDRHILGRLIPRGKTSQSYPCTA